MYILRTYDIWMTNKKAFKVTWDATRPKTNFSMPDDGSIGFTNCVNDWVIINIMSKYQTIITLKSYFRSDWYIQFVRHEHDMASIVILEVVFSWKTIRWQGKMVWITIFEWIFLLVCYFSFFNTLTFSFFIWCCRHYSSFWKSEVINFKGISFKISIIK